MRGTSIIGVVAIFLLLGFAGFLSFGLTGAVLGPLVGTLLCYAAIKAFAAMGADDGRDQRLVEETRFRQTSTPTVEAHRRNAA